MQGEAEVQRGESEMRKEEDDAQCVASRCLRRSAEISV